MPELPEVRVSSSLINKNIAGKTIKDVHVFRNKLIKESSESKFVNFLVGETIIKVDNIGKFIVFHLTNNKVMLSHLRMEGNYHSIDSVEKREKHDHVIFEFNDFVMAYNDSRAFGTFHIRTEGNYLTTLPISKLAKEPQETNPEELFEKLKKKRIAIKSSLLDQTILLGLGNIYVNEVLYVSGINPTTPSNSITLSELKTILKNSSLIMDKSTKMGGTTIKSYVSFNEKQGTYQNELLVHGKNKEQCKKCKSNIEKIKVGGRGTYFCPLCQAG